MEKRTDMESLAALVAIARAAWRTGDISLRRSAARVLRERYQTELRFIGKPKNADAKAASDA